jgi:tRNA pseudouridine55 synthase
VDRVRRVVGVRRVGHTGTLDPFATGVLPVCVGKATRLARFLTDGDKAYRATVRLGFATTTDDSTGEPLGEPAAVEVDRAALEAACAALVGPQRQRPPAYSAKRVDGRRSYDLARRGVAVEIEPVAVVVHAFDVSALRGVEVDVEVVCSAGTYVRALARDLGERLGTGAHLAALRRTRSGGFGLHEAIAWEDLEARWPGGLKGLPTLLPGMPAVIVGDEGIAAVRHGRPLLRALVAGGFPETPPPPRMRVLSESGDLVALAVPRGFEPPVPGLPVAPCLHHDVVLLS